MAAALLAAGAHLAQRATGELKILAGVLVLVTRDEEQFLLEADVAHSTLDVKFLHEAKELLALVPTLRRWHEEEGSSRRSWRKILAPNKTKAIG